MYGIIPFRVKEQVQTALGVIGFAADDFSVRNVSCPFHDDKHPSASLNKEKGLYCHACARWYTWKELAGKLGIPWPFQRHTDPAAVQNGAGEYDVSLIHGLPSETRNGLISVGLTDMARVLDLWYHYIYLTRDSIEYASLEGFACILQHVMDTYDDVGIDFKPWTFRKVYEQLQGKRLPKKAEFLRTFFLSFFLQPSEGKKPLKNSGPGRPSSGFMLWIPNDRENLSVLAAALNRDWIVHAGELRIEDYATAQRYRAASMMQDVRYLMPGKVARRQFTKSVKVSYPTIKVYADVMNVKRTTTPPKLTELTPADVIGLPENHKALRLAILQKQVKSNVFLMDSKGGRYEYSRAGAIHAAARGAGKLYRAEWQASHYEQTEA